jgi:AAT family amino acid transporter
MTIETFALFVLMLVHFALSSFFDRCHRLLLSLERNHNRFSQSSKEFLRVKKSFEYAVLMAGFQRALKARHILAVALGGTISSSYFIGNGYILNQVGPFAFLTYLLGGFITYLTMECLAELVCSESIPRHPSFVGYAKEFISPAWACGIGWAYWINWVIYISLECIAGGILLNLFIPEISIYLWSMLCAIFVMLSNLGHVRIFGAASFWLTATHIALFFGFSLFAILIYFGWIGQNAHFIGDQYFLDGGAFPFGITVFFINMVILLLNFQGTEIIGLSASESAYPKKDIPSAMKKITFTVTALYLIPIFLLALIYPWQKASLTESVFSVALESYGFTSFAKFFSLCVIAGSLSCANSGLYAASRAIHALSELNLSPSFLTKLNGFGMPARLVGITCLFILLLLQVSLFVPVHQVYLTYLSLAGCVGATAWISICLSQLYFRRHLSPEKAKTLPFKIPLYPYLTYLGIGIQVLVLLLAVFNENLRPSFLLCISAIGIPMLWYKAVYD